MRRQLILASLAAASAACATTPRAAATVAPATRVTPVAAAPLATEKSAADLADRAGDSPQTAIIIPPDAKNEGVDFENNWIYTRYGRFRRLKWGIAKAGLGNEQRHYKVITIELPDHTEHVVYFDITEIWNNWKPSVPAPQPR